MKDFLIGVAAGALGAYLAIKLSDEDTRQEWARKAQKASDRAKDEIDYGLAVGKSKALRAGVVARDEFRNAKEKFDQVTDEISEKITDEFSKRGKKAGI